MPDPRLEYSDLPETFRVSGENLPEAFAAPGESLEAVRKSEEKEVVRSRGDEATETYDDASPTQRAPQNAHKKRRWILVLAAIILVIAIALGVGLGVGLSRTNEDSGNPAAAESGSGGDDNGSDTDDEGSANQPESTPILRRDGALNGSDTAATYWAQISREGVLEQRVDDRNSLLFFQHQTGEIRWMQYVSPNVWYGGNPEEVVATDAKSGTPLDVVVNQPSNHNIKVHVFYISTDDTLKQRYMSVDSPAWYEGSLSIHGLQALNASQVALRTGRYFGAVSRANLTSNKAENCIRLFYGTTETSVQEMLWCDGFVDWQSSWNFSDINGRSSPAYMGGGIFKQVAYVAFVDLQNRTRAYWKDADSRDQFHEWAVAPGITTDEVDPHAGLSGLSSKGTLYGRDAADGSIVSWDVSLDAEHSTAVRGWSMNLPMRVDSQSDTTLDTDIAGLSFFYQMLNGSIAMAVRGFYNGPITNLVWPIPYD